VTLQTNGLIYIMLGRIFAKLQSIYYSKRPLRIMDYYVNAKQQPKGTVLVSYLSQPLAWKPGDRRFFGHSNFWECTEIVRIINDLGYSVDIISWYDSKYVSNKKYTAVFDIYTNLLRYGTGSSLKILHLTGSNPRFSNSAEMQRIADVMERRGVLLKPRRQIKEEEIKLFEQNVESADLITIFGDQVTVGTYPENVRHKMQFIPVTGSFLPKMRDPRTAKFGQEFLWYGGFGSVHKGLDLVLEVFSRHPELTLHVVGPYLKEKDFIRAYRHELTNSRNIVTHGFLLPSSGRFRMLTELVKAFILPSCSEGISPAAVTCMQYGILPVVSINCGLDVDDSMGIRLHTCSIHEIEKAVLSLCDTPDDKIRRMTINAQEYALNNYSRKAFSATMRKNLESVLP
jgi:hypothetical protein